MVSEGYGRGDSQAASLVSEYLDEHPEWTSNEFEEKAQKVAARAELEYPVNRAPSTVAAASIYLVGLVVNEKLYQYEVSDASGVSEPAIRDAYAEIADHEGIPLARNQAERASAGKEEEETLFQLLSRVISRD